MNPQDDKTDDDRDERRIASMLSAAGKDAAPPDPAFLDKLREQSTEAYLAAFPRQAPQRRRRVMVQSMVRWAASVAAALVFLVGGYLVFFAGPSGPTFGTVLANVARSDSSHFR